MEISFLKSLTGPALDKVSHVASSGTLPAFPEGMLKEDTRPDSAALQEEGRSGLAGPNAKTDGLTVSGTGNLPDKPLVYDTPGDKPDRSALQIPDIVLYPGARPEKAPETMPARPVVEPAILAPQTDDGNVVKLSDIDPESKIMPYGNTGSDGAGEADVPARPDQLTGSDPSRQRPRPGPTVLPVQQEPASPVPSGPNPVTGTAAGEVVGNSGTAADRSPKLAIPINEMPAPKTSSAERPSAGFSSVPGQTPPTVADEGSNRQAVASQRQEPDSDYTQQSAKSDPSIGTGQTKQVSGNVETLSSPPVAGSAGRTGSKNSADSSPVPMTVEPDVIEPEMKQNAESGVAAFNSLAGWRPKQTVTGDVVAGLAIGPARATAAATGNASVQNNPVPLASNAGEVVLEFDANFIDNLTREISNIAQAKGIARFALKPEHLGRIDVEIRGGEQGDDIKVTAETDAIRQLLVQSLSRLEQEIRLNGQKLAGVEIGTNLNQSQEQNARDTASSNGLKPGQVSGSAEDQDAQQYSPGSDSGHTSSGARYA